jgi:hypothetical protein
MSEQPPVQHTPKHLEEGAALVDPKHPAASAFAPLQPAAGVVADDVPEKGQNLAGGPVAADAEVTYSDQPVKLAEQHQANLQAAVGAAAEPMKVEGDTAKPAGGAAKSDKK